MYTKSRITFWIISIVSAILSCFYQHCVGDVESPWIYCSIKIDNIGYCLSKINLMLLKHVNVNMDDGSRNIEYFRAGVTLLVNVIKYAFIVYLNILLPKRLMFGPVKKHNNNSISSNYMVTRKRLELTVYPLSRDQYAEAFGNPQLNDNLMRYEWNRYLSFDETFPTECIMMPTRLAQAGFFYSGHGQEVTCYSCGVTNADWANDETAIEVHKRLSPSCKYIIGQGVDNCPIATQDRIRAPDFVICARREDTFTEYRSLWTQDVHLMASAGFYYTGSDDIVKCFHCGIGLRNWEEDDDPWIEHARFSPNCKFLQFTKGDTFVRNYRDAETQLPTPSLPQPAPQPSTTAANKCTSTLEQEYKELITAFTALLEYKRCKICLTEDANTLFRPCGHLVACQTCAEQLNTCAVCREEIVESVRVYQA